MTFNPNLSKYDASDAMGFDPNWASLKDWKRFVDHAIRRYGEGAQMCPEEVGRLTITSDKVIIAVNFKLPELGRVATWLYLKWRTNHLCSQHFLKQFMSLMDRVSKIDLQDLDQWRACAPEMSNEIPRADWVRFVDTVVAKGETLWYRDMNDEVHGVEAPYDKV